MGLGGIIVTTQRVRACAHVYMCPYASAEHASAHVRMRAHTCGGMCVCLLQRLILFLALGIELLRQLLP